MDPPPLDVARSSDKELVAFGFLADDNPELATDTTSEIVDTRITVTPRFVSRFTMLKATFETTGSMVMVNGVPQVSGVTANDFTLPVTYTVVAEDGSQQTYRVSVFTRSFSTKVDFPVGASPSSVAIADFNADGKADVAVANAGSNTVSILLNTTSTLATMPSFSTKVDFPTGMAPASVAIRDLNGDSKPDLVVANDGEASVSVLLNTTTSGATTPSFSSHVELATGSASLAAAIADFNRDGKPDLVVANSNASSVSVFLNTTASFATTPSFAAKVDFATTFTPQPANPIDLAIGDIDGDGAPDVAVQGTVGTALLLNTTAIGATIPSFAAELDISHETNGEAIAVGDLNGDSKPDVAIPCFQPMVVAVFFNTTAAVATPSFASPVSFPIGSLSSAIAIADFNADDKPDLTVTSPGTTNISVLLNTTPSGAATPSFLARANALTGPVPDSVAVGDFNADGKPDEVVANRGATSISILLAE